MKFLQKRTPEQNQRPADVSSSTATEETESREHDFTPSADDIARRAYDIFVKNGSQPGHDIEHWLEAEAQLNAERNPRP